MLPNATQVAQLLDPDENIRCSLCDSTKDRCDDCTTLLKRRYKMKDLMSRLYRLQNKKQLGKVKGQGRGTGKKKRVNWESIQASCSKAKESNPNVGWDAWRCRLLEKANPSQKEQDVILLIEAFDDQRIGWMLEQVETDEWISRPSIYREILVYIMKTSPGTSLGPNHLDMTVNARHEVVSAVATMPTSPPQHSNTIIATDATDSPPNALEQDTEGVEAVYRHSSSPLPTRPNDSLAACERQADERGDADAHTQVASGSVQRHLKRLNNEEGPESKRRRFESDKEPYLSTRPKQSAGVGTPAPIVPRPTIHELVLNRQAATPGGLSTEFEYCGQLDIPGTSDCRLEYCWSGYSAIGFLKDKETAMKSDPLYWYGEISLSLIEIVPFKDLTDSIKRSEIWKLQSEDCKVSECFTIKMRRTDAQLYGDVATTATVYCIVPKNEAPEKK
ncbi:hypothetical protein EJ07DRAFT_157500 [Lizonia empirigonia]|nr:hypothetical protein EJ07DRAFT_157500 [Lizonia empirigonia]